MSLRPTCSWWEFQWNPHRSVASEWRQQMMFRSIFKSLSSRWKLGSNLAYSKKKRRRRKIKERVDEKGEKERRNEKEGEWVRERESEHNNSGGCLLQVRPRVFFFFPPFLNVAPNTALHPFLSIFWRCAPFGGSQSVSIWRIPGGPTHTATQTGLGQRAATHNDVLFWHGRPVPRGGRFKKGVIWWEKCCF